jgi:hypothetical protein
MLKLTINHRKLGWCRNKVQYETAGFAALLVAAIITAVSEVPSTSSSIVRPVFRHIPFPLIYYFYVNNKIANRVQKRQKDSQDQAIDIAHVCQTTDRRDGQQQR